jgi:ketosteroid isomerase-like protein
MIRTTLVAILLAAGAASIADPVTQAAPHSPIVSQDEAAIRAARQDYNAALISRDAAVISKYWLQDAYSVWAGGDLTVGHDSIVKRYARTFHDGVFLSGVRKPQQVEVGSGAPNDAAEAGTWEWRMRESGEVITWSGRYLAMWRKVDGQWRIVSDLYVTTGCVGGSACR